MQNKLTVIFIVAFLFMVFDVFSFNQKEQQRGILLIHGLGGNHETWNDAVKGLSSSGFVYAGNYNLQNPYDSRWEGVNSYPSGLAKPYKDPLPLFTLDFSKNQELTFKYQSNELKETIKYLKEKLGIQELILIGHSMGGLAARRYIMDYGIEGISGLITVATPHLGSFLGYAKDLINEPDYPEYKQDIIRIVSSAAYQDSKIDIYSPAVEMLKPSSYEMLEMYNQIYPQSLPTAIIISQWSQWSKENLIKLVFDFVARDGNSIYEKDRKKSPIDIYSVQLQGRLTDGVVTVPSQDIQRAISNGNDIHPAFFYTDRFHTDANKDVDRLLEAIQSILSAIDNGSGQNNEPQHVGIGFLMDVSGSMAESDPYNFRNSCVIQLLDYIDSEDDVFIVGFNDKANWLNFDNYTAWNKNSLVNTVNGIGSNGGTSIGVGLIKMEEVMSSIVEQGIKMSVLLFSDGKSNYSNEDKWFVEQKIPIYTINYRDKANSSLLSNIASKTGGIYIKANDEMDVVMAFHQFINECKNQCWICTYRSVIKQSQTIPYSFWVDGSMKVIKVFIAWKGSKVDFFLKDPNGKIFDQSSLTSWNKESNYLHVVLNKPAAGRWTAYIKGVDIPETGEEFIFNASSDTPNLIRLSNGIYSNNKVSFELYDPSSLLTGKKIIPTLVLKTPLNQIVDISNYYTNGTISFYPSGGMGDYTLSVDLFVDGTPGTKIQRHFERSIKVGINEYLNKASVFKVLGNYSQAPLGKGIGNYPGMKCYFFSGKNISENPIASGIVIFVTEMECQIEIQQFFSGNTSIEIGDIVKLDVSQWQNDNKK